MLLRHHPIKRKIRWVILLTSAAVLLFTFSAYFVYEVVTFRQTYARQLSVLAKIVANNSTAALAFNIEEDGN